MSFQLFPPALMVQSPRLTRAGSPSSSVVGINTTPLADGAVVYCVENTVTYRLNKVSVAAPDGSMVLAPLAGPGRWVAMPSTPQTAQTGFFWLSASTLVAPADQDGSPEKPFSTLQAAIDATVLAGGFVVRAYFVDGTFVGVLPENVGLTGIGFPGPSSSVALTFHSASVQLVDVAVSSIIEDAASATGSVELSYSSYFVGGGSADIVQNIATLPGRPVHLVNAGVYGAIDCGGDMIATGCTFGGGGTPSIACAGFRFANCAFVSAIPVTSASGGTLVSCEFGAAVPVTNAVALQVDSYTDARMTAAGATNTGGRAVIG